MANVIILGGGFGGLAAATRLRELVGDAHDITVVDRAEGFAMGFAKLWDLAGQRPMAAGTRPLANLAAHGIRHLRTEITAIDGRTVRTSDGELRADLLLVALGAVSSPAHLAMLDGPGGHDLYDAAALPAIRADLDGISSGRVLVSILGGPHKCPPAPYEAALIVDGVLRARGVRDDVEVAMTTPRPITLPVAGPDASKFVADRLADHGVDLHPSHVVSSVAKEDRTVSCRVGEDGEATLSYDILLGVPANVAPPVLRGGPLVGPSGWIEVDRHTMATGHDGVWAVGDCTMITTATGQLPMAGVFAAACAEVAAANMAASLGIGEGATYEGHGYCFLELPEEKVAYVEGDFYADPPEVRMTDADHEQFLRKRAYERDHLDRWLPQP